MRSLELSLENFTSFRSRQNLDFSNLDLFAITGPTGAGKTSLLDAITFALYGHVARFGKDAKASELVSQGKENLKVSFRFSVRGVEYRVSRTWRKRGKTDESKALLEVLQNGTEEKLETKEKSVTKRVEEILGMDFDTFTRVILLPQGKFDEFIKGNKAKRREILRELASFEIFERMRKQANEQAKILKNEYELLERQRTELQLPSEAEVAQKEQNLTTIEQQLPTLNNEVLKAQKALDEAEELFKNISRLVSLQEELNNLQAKSVEIEDLKVRLQQARAADKIQDQYTLLQDARNREKQAQAATLSAQKHLNQAKQELEKQGCKLDEALAYQKEMEPQFKTQSEALNSAKNYDEQQKQYQLELKRAKKNQAQRQDNLDSVAQVLNNTEIKLQEAVQQAEEAESAIAQYSPGGTRLEQLQQVSPLLVSWELVREQTLKSRRKQENTTSEKQQADTTCQDVVVKLEQARLTLQQRERLLQEAENANNLAIQNNHAAALRQILHDGDNCPVCNGTYREAQLLPLPEVAIVDTKELREQKSTAEKAQKAAEKAVTKAETTLDNFKQKELECSQDLAANEAKLADLQQQISTVLQTDSWEVNALKQELKALQESDNKYNEALAKQKDAVALVRESQQAKESASNTHDTASSEFEAAKQEVKRWEQQLEQVEIKLHEITGGQSYTDLLSALEKEKQELEKRLQDVNKSYQTAQTSVIQYKTKNEEANKIAEEARIQKEQLEINWQATLRRAEFTEESFISAQAESVQQTNWQKKITEYSNVKVKLETQVEEVKSQIGTRTTDESTINSLGDAKIAAFQQFQQAQDQRANLLAWVHDAKSKQKQAEKLEANLSFVKEKSQIYSTLARNCQTDEFQDIYPRASGG
ncbi:SMC family ATPase [Scytonema sp. PRP1]|uniref:SMC family ATPase n=1 Tax=Scytonema sp. PRP1 TaxID=3120513 RepID=UPI00300D857C